MRSLHTRSSKLAQQILLQSEDARLFIHGDFIDYKEINAIFDLKQLDLSKWLTQQQSTDISGQEEAAHAHGEVFSEITPLSQMNQTKTTKDGPTMGYFICSTGLRNS